MLDFARDGFDGFGSRPSPSQLPISRFYSASLVDDARDGTYDIRAEFNNCEPDCASGPHRYELFRWDGHDYRPA
ncbi:hypothetical protein EAD89_04265 [Micromonospora sp. BL4]|uniref:hypothetical protein n=1 Tax=Micromonospora sp. BL4 TaxID=2478710 RepID=UPI000EF57010|nr:hypothetical protein [Micromonospora sp. BL4]RLP94360.1 hypothetical protein EAD89_04265 [Micromonospora sp. BL4]